MVFIHTYFYKVNLISLTYSYANIAQGFFYLIGKNLTSIFCRKYQMI